MQRLKLYMTCFGIAVGVLAFAATPAGAATITWTGDGDGTLWSDPDNWDLDRVPMSTDDVVISSTDYIAMDMGLITPYTIASLTVDGSVGGKLTILTLRDFVITNDFESNDSDTYDLFMDAKSTLSVDDLTLIDVTMTDGLSTNATVLTVNGQIDRGAFVVNDYCEVTTADGVTGSGTTEYDWTIDGGTVDAGPSTLWGDWILTGADVTLEEMYLTDQFAQEVRLMQNSTLEIDPNEFVFTGFISDANDGDRDFVYDSGTLIVRTATNAAATVFLLSEYTRIKPYGNNSSMQMLLWAEFYIDSYFGHSWVRSGWDTRTVDVVAKPIQTTAETAQGLELISPNLEDSYYRRAGDLHGCALHGRLA